MSIRFVIGRAGCGKTHHCLESIRSRLREDPIAGPNLILLVPEQSSLQMERAILEGDDIAGSHRAGVLSFHRLAYRVIESAGGSGRRALSDPARAMVLRHLVATHTEKLTYYKRVERLGGFIEQLSHTVTELIQEAVDPDDLSLPDGEQPEDPVQRAKLDDIRLIYDAYLGYLGDERLDPSQYLEVAREFLPRCDWLRGARLWVDGFASLMRQETLTLIALARLCESVEITLLCDPGVCDASGPSAGGPMDQLFSKPRRTYLQMQRAFAEAGLSVEDPLVLRSPTPPRFRSSKSLAALERDLFRRYAPSADAQSGQVVEGVELVELPTRRLEAAYALSRICEWVRDPQTGYRYRDVAIIVRDLEPYHELLTSALTQAGVPFFIDRRRTTGHHPLVELIRGAASLAAGDLSLNAVRLVLKTGLVPVDPEAGDELENYLLGHGVEGLKAWTSGEWVFANRRGFLKDDEETEPSRYEREASKRINETRRRFLECFEPWLAFASPGTAHLGGEWTSALLDLVRQLEVPWTLAGWARSAEEDGDLDQAEEHRQVWRDVMSFLDDLAFAFSETALSIEELAGVLEAGLSRFTLGLAPPMLDQVLVGSIERSRHPDLKAAVILGFNDGMFPRAVSEDSILNDDDRALLRTGGVPILPSSRERTLEESLLIYIAATRPSEKLVLTYATADNDGQTLRVSPYKAALQAACPGLQAEQVADPWRSREEWDVNSMGGLAQRIVGEIRGRPPIASDDSALRSRWNGIYEAVRGDRGSHVELKRAFESLGKPIEAVLSSASVKRLHPTELHTSVSELESYATCPFQHFGRYGLRLRERAEAELAPVDVGQVHHAILEDCVTGLAETGAGLGRISDDELLRRLDDSCQRVAEKLPSDGPISRARDAYVLRRSAAHLARVLRAQKSIAGAGQARPQAAELPFGFDREDSLGALEISTPAGRKVRLRGFIDRVDLAELADELLGIVIDYKRTRDKKLDLAHVYHGLSLQLIGYLLALADSGQSLTGRPIRPIAALYVSLTPRYDVVDHPSLSGEGDAGLSGTYGPRGLIDAEGLSVLDQRCEGGWSEYYSFYRKNDGSLGHIDRGDAAEHRSFKQLLDHTRRKLGELADGIWDGRVAVSPYRLGTFSPCSWCPLADVCGFEMGLSDARFLDSLRRSQVYARLADADRGGDSDTTSKDSTS